MAMATDEEVGASIRRRRKALSISQQHLAALASELSKTVINQQDVHRIEHGAFSRAVPAVTEALDVVEGRPASAAVPRASVVQKPLPAARGDLPVYASARGGPGEILFSFDPVDYVGRPEPLANVRNGFAMYIVGDSMSPAFEQGDLAFINPHVPYRSGNDVLIFRDWEGEQAAVVKRLVRATTDDWQLEQFNPAKKLKLPRAEWPQCYVIVFKQYSHL